MDSQSSPATDGQPGSRVEDDGAAAIVWLDAAGSVTARSTGAEALLGWTAAEATGRAVADLAIAPEARATHATALVRHLKSSGAGLDRELLAL